VRCETKFQHHEIDIDGRETYMFAPSCEDVHKGNTASGRSMALRSGGARKETVHRVLKSGPFDVACGVVASR
jgi:hypothetical protein